MFLWRLLVSFEFGVTLDLWSFKLVTEEKKKSPRLIWENLKTDQVQAVCFLRWISTWVVRWQWIQASLIRKISLSHKKAVFKCIIWELKQDRKFSNHHIGFYYVRWYFGLRSSTIVMDPITRKVRQYWFIEGTSILTSVFRCSYNGLLKDSESKVYSLPLYFFNYLIQYTFSMQIFT